MFNLAHESTCTVKDLLKPFFTWIELSNAKTFYPILVLHLLLNMLQHADGGTSTRGSHHCAQKRCLILTRLTTFLSILCIEQGTCRTSMNSQQRTSRCPGFTNLYLCSLMALVTSSSWSLSLGLLRIQFVGTDVKRSQRLNEENVRKSKVWAPSHCRECLDIPKDLCQPCRVLLWNCVLSNGIFS